MSTVLTIENIELGYVLLRCDSLEAEELSLQVPTPTLRCKVPRCLTGKFEISTFTPRQAELGSEKAPSYSSPPPIANSDATDYQ
jgi:hypothetical protein